MIEAAAALHGAATRWPALARRYRQQARERCGVIPYASCTGSSRNLTALCDAGWRLLLSPANPIPPPGFGYAIDNGAWSIFQAGREWGEADSVAFARLLERQGRGADWVVLPDIVGGGQRSLDLSLSWLHRIQGLRLLAVQDAMEVRQIRPLLSNTVGVFVGGSTEWKLQTAHQWIALAHEIGAYCHIGRVNTRRRIYQMLGADSFDGTSATRFSKNVPLLDGARRQVGLFVGG